MLFVPFVSFASRFVSFVQFVSRFVPLVLFVPFILFLRTIHIENIHPLCRLCPDLCRLCQDLHSAVCVFCVVCVCLCHPACKPPLRAIRMWWGCPWRSSLVNWANDPSLTSWFESARGEHCCTYKVNCLTAVFWQLVCFALDLTALVLKVGTQCTQIWHVSMKSQMASCSTNWLSVFAPGKVYIFCRYLGHISPDAYISPLKRWARPAPLLRPALQEIDKRILSNHRQIS